MPDSTTLPAGTVTFLFTDVAGSTRLWERHPDQMRAALVEHDALIEFLAEQHGGAVVRPRGEGDSRFCVFRRATDAVAAAAAIQRALHAEAWPPEAPLRVRMALRTGEADLRDGDYYGH
jgi:class 3 adenylate cyclase